MIKDICVSIIIPIYNSEKYLRNCLDSVVNQTLREIEIICVNDGSTDGSMSILREYEQSDPRIIIIEQDNSGVSAARNRGLKSARGNYIAFLDSDDYLELNTYKKTYKKAISQKADILVFGGDSCPKSIWANEKLNARKITYRGEAVKALFQENGSRPFCFNKLYRRELFHRKDIYFDTDLRLGEDLALMFDLFPKANTVCFIKDKFYHYRIRNDSAMAGFNGNINNKLKKHLQILYHIIHMWKLNGYTEQYRKDLVEWIICFTKEDVIRCRYNSKTEVCKELINIIESLIDPEALDAIYSEQYREWKNWTEAPYIPKVSVIMPVYNAEDYLGDTLDCLSAQKYKNYEVIFVDDGSKDRSLEIINQYTKDDCRARVLTQQHKFAGAARNYGMRYAKGEYLLFLDSDDFFSPDLILKAVEKIDQSGADICVFPADRFNQVTKNKSPMRWTCNTDLIPVDSEIFARHTNAKNIFWFTTPAPWNKLFRKSFIIDNQILFQNTRSANDLAFVMYSLAIAESITTIKNVLITYRVNNKYSLQGSQDKKNDAFYEALLELKKRLIERGIYYEIEPAFINFALDFCIYNLRTMPTKKSYEETFYLLKQKAFEELNLLRWPKDYFYAYKLNHIFENRDDIMTLSPNEYARKHGLLFGEERMKAELGLNDKVADPLKISLTDRTKKAILWVPKKLKGGFICLKDNGLKYTIYRVGEKLKERINK